MNTTLKIVKHNGEELPYSFNLAAWRKLGIMLNENSVSKLQEKITTAQGDLDNLDNLDLMAKFYFCGFAEGHRIAGKAFTKQVEDMYDPELVTALSQVFMEETAPVYNSTQEKQSIEAAPNA